MNVILQKEVANWGKVGDQVSVKRGYFRNYLLPQGMALLATPDNIAAFEAHRSELEKAAAEIFAQAKHRAEKLQTLTVVINAQAGDEGKLFGSVGPRDIVDAVVNHGVQIEKKEVLMPEGPIRQTGEFTITLKLHSEVSIPLKLKVVATAAETRQE